MELEFEEEVEFEGEEEDGGESVDKGESDEEGRGKMTRKTDCVDTVLRNNSEKNWAIQAGLLTPLNFARHRLSPLAALTSGAYFFHNGRR